MIANHEAALWHDRGRWWAIGAVVVTLVAAGYVIATSHSTFPLIPATASLAGIAGRTQRSASALRATAFVIMMLCAALGAASVGFMFVPGVAAMIVALVRTGN